MENIAVDQVFKYSQLQEMNEGHLKEYAERVIRGELEVGTPVSVEIARLGSTECAQSILRHLKLELPDQFEDIQLLPTPRSEDEDGTAEELPVLELLAVERSLAAIAETQRQHSEKLDDMAAKRDEAESVAEPIATAKSKAISSDQTYKPNPLGDGQADRRTARKKQKTSVPPNGWLSRVLQPGG